jgi:hypothetical protein
MNIPTTFWQASASLPNENRRFLAEIAPEAPALGLKLFVD